MNYNRAGQDKLVDGTVLFIRGHYRSKKRILDDILSNLLYNRAMFYNPALTTQDAIARFGEAERVIGHLDTLWKIGSIVVKFGELVELKEEHLNGEIFRLLGGRIPENHLVEFSLADKQQLEKINGDIDSKSSGYDTALFMPYLPNGTFKDGHDRAYPEQRDRIMESYEQLAVPYAIANIRDRHPDNIMTGIECPADLITIDTRYGLFHTAYGVTYRGWQDDVVKVYKDNLYRMGLNEPDNAEALDRSIEQCEDQIDLITREENTLNKFRQGLAKDLIHRATVLSNYLISI
jgi:hypothetical protein